MGLNNKIIPNEKLSSRERIERKIDSFEGRPFTLKDINRLLRPKMKLDSIRYHVESMVNNLHVEKLPREGREHQLYVKRDVLREIENETSLNGAAHSFLVDLYHMAIALREGDVIPIQRLRDKREELGGLIDDLRDEVYDLARLHDCDDLWNPATLVKRLGFIEGENGSSTIS